MSIKLSNNYLSLGEPFYEKVAPVADNSPSVFLWNPGLAKELGLPSELTEDAESLAQYFSGNQVFPDSTPIALAYAGHQFGSFNPQLGDGRAHLLGEVDVNGELFDIQLKGSGQTPYSRRGDGLCGLGPAVREFIMSEAMYALGVPTSRTLAVVTTGKPVYRDRVTPGAVVTRVAASHIRVGTFEYFKSQGDFESVAKLCDFAVQRHYPHLAGLSGTELYTSFLEAVYAKQIELICQWMRVGFIHGVMNTDNTTISGETIDYGPCAMMNAYSPNTVFSSIDTMGRYRFGYQPQISHWNMTRLTECFLPLIDEDSKKAIKIAEGLLSNYVGQYQQSYFNMMASKLGISTFQSDDEALIDDLLKTMGKNTLDYTNTFNLLTQTQSDDVAIAERAETTLTDQLGDWIKQWKNRLQEQGEESDVVFEWMRSQNPVVIPRNHHIERVISSCIEDDSTAEAENFLNVLVKPYQETELTKDYQDPPEDNDRYYQTFCGT